MTDQYKAAFEVWQEKTEWVQKTGKYYELGMHRADVLRQRIEKLEAELVKESARTADFKLKYESTLQRLDMANALNKEAREKLAKNQPKLIVRLRSFPESNGKRNWTAMFMREGGFHGLIGNAGGITIDRGEYWNRVAYSAEKARFLLGERITEPDIVAYGDDVKTPEEWKGQDEEGVFARKGE